MATLFIDTATSDIGYALWKGHRPLIGRFSGDRDAFVSSLFEFVRSKMTKFSSIEEVVVVHGPGMFTGIRIGCLIANAFARAMEAETGRRPVVRVIDTLTAQVPPDDTGRAYSCVRAGKHDYYIAEFRDGVRVSDIGLYAGQALADVLEKATVQEARLYVAADADLVAPRVYPRSMSDRIGVALARLKLGQLLATDRALPLYIKAPNITIKKKSA